MLSPDKNELRSTVVVMIMNAQAVNGRKSLAGSPRLDPAIDSVAHSLCCLLSGLLGSHTGLKLGLEFIQSPLKFMREYGVDAHGDGFLQRTGGRLRHGGL